MHMESTIHNYVASKHKTIFEICKKVVFNFDGDLATAHDISQEVCEALLNSKSLDFPFADEQRAFGYIYKAASSCWYQRRKLSSKLPIVELHEGHSTMGDGKDKDTIDEFRRVPGIKRLQALNEHLVRSG